MSDIAAIKTALRDVVTNVLATTAQYRTLTSNPGVDNRTWSAWTDINGVFNSKQSTQEYDNERQVWNIMWTATFRTSDVLDLNQGDQLKTLDENGTTYSVWAITGADAGSTGTIRYTLVWQEPILASGVNRGGGV